MDPLKLKFKKPEQKIQDAIIAELEKYRWYVKATHGNMYQAGWPDLYCVHKRYGHKWLECKTPDRAGHSAFTAAQLEEFPKMAAAGACIYVVTTHIDIQNFIITTPPNWAMVLLGAKSIRR